MRAQLPLVIVTDQESGRVCAVNALQVESFEDLGPGSGTEITFASGTTLTARESFGRVLQDFKGGRSRHR